MRRRLQSSGHDPQEQSSLAEAPEELLGSREHLVGLGALDFLREPFEVGGEEPRHLPRVRLAPDDASEGSPGDDGIGHAGLRELADVGEDPVEPLERPAPAPGPARR